MDWIQNQSIYLLLDFFRQNKVCQKIRETSRFVVSGLVVGYPVSYRVFNNVLTQFRQLCWEYRLWFVLIFWVLCVHEIGKFMPNFSVFIALIMRSIYGTKCKHSKKIVKKSKAVKILSEFCFQCFWVFLCLYVSNFNQGKSLSFCYLLLIENGP